MKYWLMFGLLGLIWGSSYLLIKIGVQELDALSLVSGRLGSAAVAFIIFLAVVRKPLPRDLRTLASLGLLGFTNTTLPFVLISWGEGRIDSGLAGVLNATTPLFAVVIAHFALTDDRFNLGKALGLGTGFVGVTLLALRSVDPNHPNPIEGQVAVLLASLSYAFSVVFIRRNLRHVDPMVTAGVSLTSGALIANFLLLLTVRPLPNVAALQGGTVLAVLVLGLVNTFIAYLLFFNIIHAWGATRSTLVTYIAPPISLLLGAVTRGEHIDTQLVIGAGLIIVGVAFVNWPTLRKLFAGRAVGAAASSGSAVSQ